jgi:hypothetical protein
MPWKSKPKAAPSTGMRNRGIQATKRATSTIIGYEKATKISLTAYREKLVCARPLSNSVLLLLSSSTYGYARRI